MRELPAPNFAHLVALSGPRGTYEHARFREPRREHGFCVDDVARVMVVLQREVHWSDELAEIAETSMKFLALAQDPSGRIINRRTDAGEWVGASSRRDCWGRALWALGMVANRDADRSRAELARGLFDRGVAAFSAFPRSMAFATFGAVEVLASHPDDVGARELVLATVALLNQRDVSVSWRWPEARLHYANASLPEALLAAGYALGDDQIVTGALRRLQWLLEVETRGEHLSVTPVGGRGPGEASPRFDQQPIEVAAIASACARAHGITGDDHWLEPLARAARWFLGDNDLGVEMFDRESGGGYDGLTARGPNGNQGAESTIALIETLQQARSCVPMMR